MYGFKCVCNNHYCIFKHIHYTYVQYDMSLARQRYHTRICWHLQEMLTFWLVGRHGKTGQTRLTRPVWPATRLTRNPIDPFKNDPFWPVTHFNPRPDWPDPNPNPTRTFCHVYQCWVDWDWGVIFIKYLLILFYLICYVLHYSLLFFTCHLYFLFLL